MEGLSLTMGLRGIGVVGFLAWERGSASPDDALEIRAGLGFTVVAIDFAGIGSGLPFSLAAATGVVLVAGSRAAGAAGAGAAGCWAPVFWAASSASSLAMMRSTAARSSAVLLAAAGLL